MQEPNAGEGGAGGPPETNESNKARDLTRVYHGDGITVYWYARRCIHDAACIRAQPRVFDSRRRPWIDPAQGDAEAIAAAVRACPTGALEYRLADGSGEAVESVASFRRVPNGPVFVRGNLMITDEEGTIIRQATRLALCQCGKSANKPFCDNSHRANR